MSSTAGFVFLTERSERKDLPDKTADGSTPLTMTAVILTERSERKDLYRKRG